MLCGTIEAMYGKALSADVRNMLTVDDWLADIADDLLDYEVGEQR